MRRPSQSARKELERAESFEERIDILFEELELAIQWQRPSILLAFYESEYVRADAELALEKRLAEVGQDVLRFTVNERQFDIPLLLSQHLERDHSVFSITSLSWGGGKGGANAYRALNIRREYFVDYSIRAIFWLTRDEATDLPRYAPDFWAFRHRVIEFNDPSKLEHLVAKVDELAGLNHESHVQSENLDEQIAMRESLLTDLPEQDEAVATRLDLLSTLAALYQEKGEYYQSIERLKQGIDLARRLDSSDLLALFWGRLGVVYLVLDNPKNAIRAYRKAIRLIPQDAKLWSGLGGTYLVQGRMEIARRAFKKAIKFSPQDAIPWAGLGRVYRMLGRTEDALSAYRKAVQFAPQDAITWGNLGDLLIELGRLQDALDACNKAIELTSHNASPWNSLGHIYRMEKRFSDAIIAYQHAIALEPQNPATRSSLVACYRLLGKDNLAEEQIKLARPFMKNESEYNRAVFESVCGNINKAIGLLTIAVEKKQVGLNRLHHDPNLNFIRGDPRFELLLQNTA